MGPLTFSFSYYKIMPQPGGPAPDDRARPDQRRRAAHGPAGARRTACGWRRSTSRTCSRSARSNDGHEIDEDEYNERVHALVLAIRDRLREPDVIAVQEVAIFATAPTR